MDTSETTTHVGLCAGYGGIELGLKRVIANLRSVALCEIEAFACANLVAKMEAGLMDPAPVWSNLKTFPWEEFRDRVDILTGGYPCQPFSAAGKRLGAQDERHLWPFISAGIALMRPRICFFENVEGHISLGLSDVLQDIGGMGYRATWGIFSAAEAGAPHQRKRVFILAHRQCEGLERWRFCVQSEGLKLRSSDHSAKSSNILVNYSLHRLGYERRDERTQKELAVTSLSSGYVADSDNCGWRQDRMSAELRPAMLEQPSGDCRGGDDGKAGQERQAWPSRPAQSQHGWEPPRVVGDSESAGQRRKPQRELGAWKETNRERKTDQHNTDGPSPKERKDQPPLGGDADGPAGRMDYAKLCVSCDNRTDELRLLGNGVVPATAEIAFRTLIQEFL